MSASIYYHARRTKPLTKSEAALVRIIVMDFSVDAKIKKYLDAGEGLNWESFSFYDKRTSPDFVLEGSTKLPDNTKDALWEGAVHWCIVLTFLRLVISDAEWKVSIEGSPIRWDEKDRRYDPST